MVQLDPYWQQQWDAFFGGPAAQVEWAFRQMRAQQIQKLLANPAQVDLQTFNDEVWPYGRPFYFQGHRYRYYNDFDNMPPDVRPAFLRAIELGTLEVHGNYMWDQPTWTFDSGNPNVAQKTANIRLALRYLNDAALRPEDKAHEIMKIRGFGASNATALVWVFHPKQYAVCNKRSVYAVNLMTHAKIRASRTRAEDVDRFQTLAGEVRDQLKASDFLVLDCFFDVVYWTVPFEAAPDGEIHVTEEECDAYPEGASKYVTHLRYERNRDLVEAAKHRFLKRHGSLYCEACGFDFKVKYGELGEGFIEVHHKIPVSQMNGAGFTQVSEVALVCPNCHKMLHRHQPLLSIEGLKELIEAAKQHAVAEGRASTLPSGARVVG